MKYVIFFSWQSDTESKYNRNYIKGLLNDFASRSDCSIEIKESVGDCAGSPNIVDKVISKIDKCNIFVCDVTPITTFNNKDLPNPNVLFELGYAVSRLGWERIICVSNTAYSESLNMPFDIRQNRISQYRYSNKEKTELKLGDFLLAIINNYDDIVRRFNSASIKKHDTDIFKKFTSLVNEEELMDGLLSMRHSYTHTGYDGKLWNSAICFTDYPQNRYIISDLNKTYEDFVKSICIMKKRLSIIMYVSHDWLGLDPLVEHSQEEIDNNLREELFGLHNIICKEFVISDFNSYYGKIEQHQEEVRDLVDSVCETYQKFRDKIKESLFI